MLRIILLGLAIVSVQALPSEWSFEEDEAEFFESLPKPSSSLMLDRVELEIKNTADLIKYIQAIPIGPGAKPQVDGVIQVLQRTEVSAVIDSILIKYPELPGIIKGIRLFLTGPDAKPLIDALKQTIVPLIGEARKLYEKIVGPVEEFAEAVTEQSVRLFFLLQQPDVIGVIQKLQILPQLVKLQEYGIDLVKGLKDLENLITSPK